MVTHWLAPGAEGWYPRPFLGTSSWLGEKVAGYPVPPGWVSSTVKWEGRQHAPRRSAHPCVTFAKCELICCGFSLTVEPHQGLREGWALSAALDPSLAMLVPAPCPLRL